MNLAVTNPHPIVSLSLNPAIDLTYEVKQLKHDQKSRATNSYFDPGGTGVNVGRALQKLNSSSYTCYISAGKMGDFLDIMLKQELDNLIAIRAEGETRINTTLLQQQPLNQFEINATGTPISLAKLDEVITVFLKYCQQGIGVLTGSLPPGLNHNTYKSINTKLQQQGARAIIDAPVDTLKTTLNSKPFLIKPNQHELEALCNSPLVSIEQIALQARKLNSQGINYVCVSLAEKGAVLVSQENSYHCQPPQVHTHSTVGCGDAMVAGLAHAFSNKYSDTDALKLAVACGAGTASQPGTQLFKTDKLGTLSSQSKITILDI